jgi:hypothetical protein
MPIGHAAIAKEEIKPLMVVGRGLQAGLRFRAIALSRLSKIGLVQLLEIIFILRLDTQNEHGYPMF